MLSQPFSFDKIDTRKKDNMKKIKIIVFSLFLLTGCSIEGNSFIFENSSETSSEFVSNVSSSNDSTSESTITDVSENNTSKTLKAVKREDKFSAYYIEDKLDTLVDIHLEEGENGIIESSSNRTYYGNRFIVDATPEEGYHFSYYLKNNKYMSSEKSTLLYVTLTNNISGHFTKDGFYSVLFLSPDGSILENIDIAEGEKVEMYSYPQIEGYDLHFNIDLGDLDKVQRDLVVLPTYIKSGTPKIDAINCTYDEGEYNYGDSILFKYQETNKLFEYYKVNGEIFSSSSNLELAVYEDVTVEAIYGSSFYVNTPLVSLQSTAIKTDENTYFRGYSSPVKNGNSSPADSLTQIENGILIKENIDDTYEEATVMTANTIDEAGYFFTSVPTSLISNNYLQSYAVYRKAISDEYVYYVTISDVYQML